MSNKNKYLAVVYNGDSVLHEIPCSEIFMNNVGGTHIRGYIESGNIGWEITLAVIPSSFIVRLNDLVKIDDNDIVKILKEDDNETINNFLK